MRGLEKNRMKRGHHTTWSSVGIHMSCWAQYQCQSQGLEESEYRWPPTPPTCVGCCPPARSTRWRLLEWGRDAGTGWLPSAGPLPWPSRRGGGRRGQPPGCCIPGATGCCRDASSWRPDLLYTLPNIKNLSCKSLIWTKQCCKYVQYLTYYVSKKLYCKGPRSTFG